nr:MAG TPA: hypothetical protein [Bacteriophage sp.]
MAVSHFWLTPTFHFRLFRGDYDFVIEVSFDRSDYILHPLK